MYKKVYQRSLKDCGVACLLSIIRYYKGDNTFDNIKKLARCNNNGITALNLIEASTKLGFNAKGLKCQYEDLDTIAKPSICHIVLENGYNHYVVLYKYTQNYVVIFDPYYGIKRYNKKEFLKIWNNIIIELIPARKLDVIKEQNYKKFFDIVIQNKYSYIIIILLSFFSIIFTLINSYYFKTLIDGFNTISIVVLFGIVIVIKETFDFFRNKLLIKLQNKIDNDITLTMHSRMLSLPNYYFNNNISGDIITKYNDVEYIRDLLIKFPIFILIDLSLLIITSILLIKINLMLSIIFFVTCFVYFMVILIFDKKMKDLIQKIQECNSLKNGILIENINLVNTIKNLNIKSYRHNIFNSSYDLFINISKKYNNLYNNLNLIKNIIIYVEINILLFLGIKLVNGGNLLLSELILFDSLMIYFIEPLKDMCDLNPILKKGINSIKRVNEIYSNDKCVENNIELRNYDIKFYNLTFSYDNYTNIIKDFNYTINYGEKLFVTGVSGSGKSTIFRLLNKDYETKNMIYIGNEEINKINVSKYITYISQDERLFNDTLYNNIVLDSDSTHLDEVLEITGLNKVFKYKNINLNSIIEENGNNLSMGERERIILSRALLKNNKILILDESLSGIDLSEEYNIIEKILSRYMDKTIIYISHSDVCNKLFNKILKVKEE